MDGNMYWWVGGWVGGGRVKVGGWEGKGGWVAGQGRVGGWEGTGGSV